MAAAEPEALLCSLIPEAAARSIQRRAFLATSESR